MTRRFLLFFALLSFFAPALAQTTGPLPSAAVARIEAAIQEEMKRQGIPGMSVAVVTEHQLRWASGYGLADVENNVPATAATVYRLASISKPITATAVMQLAEKGKIDLDAPIQKYVPGFPRKPWPVTARQLLGHLGGIRHYRGSEMGSTRHYTDLTAPLAVFQNDPLLHEPGTKYTYTTYGYNLLGAAVEGASGQGFADYMRDHIFRPAGMSTIRVDDVFAIIPRRAQGYRKAEDGRLQNSGLADTSNKIPGGGFASTVEDLAQFAIALQTDRLVRADTRARMFTPQKTKDGSPTTYGLGWGISARDGERAIAHSGGQQRVSTLLYMRPEDRAAVVLMANLEGAALSNLARQILDSVVSPSP